MTNLVACNRIIAELTLLLKAEIKQLRAGNYHDTQQLSVLKSEKMSMLADAINEFSKADNFLQAKALLANQLAFLNALGAENSKLLLAISNGIKSARQRIHRLQNTGSLVGIYGRKGTRISFSEDPATREKNF